MFVESPSWNGTRDRFDRLNEVVDTLSEEVERITEGFKENSQLNSSFYLH